MFLPLISRFDRAKQRARGVADRKALVTRAMVRMAFNVPFSHLLYGPEELLIVVLPALGVPFVRILVLSLV